MKCFMSFLLGVTSLGLILSFIPENHAPSYGTETLTGKVVSIAHTSNATTDTVFIEGQRWGIEVPTSNNMTVGEICTITFGTTTIMMEGSILPFDKPRPITTRTSIISITKDETHQSIGEAIR